MGKAIALHGVSNACKRSISSAIRAGAPQPAQAIGDLLPRRGIGAPCRRVAAPERLGGSLGGYAYLASVAPASGPEKRRSEPRRRERLSAISRAGHIETRSSAPRISLAYYPPTETLRPRKSSIMR